MSRSAQLVRHACQVLSSFLELLRLSEDGQAQVAPADLACTFVAISRVGEILQSPSPKEPDPELEAAFGQYRALLERLRQTMPLLHGRLLTERARLEAQRAHLEAAHLWAETSRTAR